MMKCYRNFLLVFFLISMLAGCLADKKYAYPREKENQEMVVDTKGGESLMRKFGELPPVSVMTLKERIDRTKERGLAGSLVINLINEVTIAIKTLIANERNKYSTVSQFSKTDLYFYDQPSLDGPFDPAGLQFRSFDLVRTIPNGSGKPDTAFFAEFALDTSKAGEILNNSMFALKLKKFWIKYVKPKVALGGEKKMSIEFDISFLTSYVNDKGNILDSILLGKFHLLLKDISIDLTDQHFGTCPTGAGDQQVYGRSFVVPRSFGYFKTEKGIVPGYGQGLFSIQAIVKESTRPVYGTAVINENGIIILNTVSGHISRRIHE